ncbi:MAG: hypothetical protein GY953_30640, partial [bacterium]|nr:hypothetical protein [bacterium]
MRLAALGLFLLVIASPGAPPVSPAESASAAGLTPRQIADRIAAPFLAQDQIRVNYTNDLTLIALLAMYDATGDDGYLDAVRKVMRDRGQPPGFVHRFRSQPFCSISLELYLRTKDSRYVKPFLDETAKYRAEAPRSYDGAISHYGDPALGRILIDQIQDYTSRMAHAGTIGGDRTFHREAVGQWRLFRDALRNQQTGLWGHARGWFEDPIEIVPTAWGRGQ